MATHCRLLPLGKRRSLPLAVLAKVEHFQIGDHFQSSAALFNRQQSDVKIIQKHVWKTKPDNAQCRKQIETVVCRALRTPNAITKLLANIRQKGASFVPAPCSIQMLWMFSSRCAGDVIGGVDGLFITASPHKLRTRRSPRSRGAWYGWTLSATDGSQSRCRTCFRGTVITVTDENQNT